MHRLLRTFLAGAAVCVPLAITIWVVYAAGTWLDSLGVRAGDWIGVRIGSPVGETLRANPGVGVLAVLGVIYLVGLGTRFWLFARLVGFMEALLGKVPLVKTLYGAIRDMLSFISSDSGSLGKVVLYKVPGQDVRMLAILTNEHPVGLPEAVAHGRVAIYLPMSYQVAGYMLYVPAEALEPVDMSVEQVMKLAATAEVGARSLLGLPAPHGRTRDAARTPPPGAIGP